MMPKPERYPVVVVEHPNWLSGAVPALPSLCCLWNLPCLPEAMEILWTASHHPSRRPQASHNLLGKSLRDFPQPLGKPAAGPPTTPPADHGFPIAPTGSTTTKKSLLTKGGSKPHFHQVLDFDPVVPVARLRRTPAPSGSLCLSNTLQPGHEPPECWNPHGYPLRLYPHGHGLEIPTLLWSATRTKGTSSGSIASIPMGARTGTRLPDPSH